MGFVLSLFLSVLPLDHSEHLARQEIVERPQINFGVSAENGVLPACDFIFHVIVAISAEINCIVILPEHFLLFAVVSRKITNSSANRTLTWRQHEYHPLLEHLSYACVCRLAEYGEHTMLAIERCPGIRNRVYLSILILNVKDYNGFQLDQLHAVGFFRVILVVAIATTHWPVILDIKSDREVFRRKSFYPKLTGHHYVIWRIKCFLLLFHFYTSLVLNVLRGLKLAPL